MYMCVYVVAQQQHWSSMQSENHFVAQQARNLCETYVLFDLSSHSFAYSSIRSFHLSLSLLSVVHIFDT